MADAVKSGLSRGTTDQPKHGPWGHKDKDTLSSPEAAAVFPAKQPIKPVPKQKQQESGVTK